MERVGRLSNGERQVLSMMEARLEEDEPGLADLFRTGFPEPDRSLLARVRPHAVGLWLGVVVVAITVVTLIAAGPVTGALVGCLAASTAAALVTAMTVQHHEPFLDHPHLW